MKKKLTFGFTLAEVKPSRVRSLDNKMTKSLQVSSVGTFKARRSAFTLAEVLITLGIIGIVAALTIPILMAKIQDKEVTTKVQEAYSILTQAYRMGVKDYGTADGWKAYSWSTVGAENLAKPFVENLKVAQDCGASSNISKGKICWTNSKMKYLDGNYFNGSTWNLVTESRVYNILLLNGMSVSFHPRANSSTGYCDKDSRCGYIIVDIDGPNSGPLKMGYDLFIFEVYTDRLAPNEAKDTDKYVTGGDTEGWGAGWWVINKHNLNYQRCLSKLTKNGKSTCN